MVAPQEAYCGRCGALVLLDPEHPSLDAIPVPRLVTASAAGVCECGALNHARIADNEGLRLLLTGCSWEASAVMPPPPLRVEAEPVIAALNNAVDTLDRALIKSAPVGDTFRYVKHALLQLVAAVLGVEPLRLPCMHCGGHRADGSLGMLSLPAPPHAAGSWRNFPFCSDDPVCMGAALRWHEQGGDQ